MTYTYTHKTITTIKTVNISNTPKTFLVSLCNSLCWTGHSFSTAWPLHFYQKSVFHIDVGLFLDSILFHLNIFVFMPIPHSPDYCSFKIILEIRWCYPSNFVLFFQRCSANFGPSHFHMNFKFSLCLSAKKILLGFWLGLCWVYRLICRVFTA